MKSHHTFIHTPTAVYMKPFFHLRLWKVQSKIWYQFLQADLLLKGFKYHLLVLQAEEVGVF